MTERKHTPGPWSISRIGFGSVVAGKRHICSTAGYSSNIPDEDYESENAANAEFICRAVNCHEELLEALEFYVTMCGNTAYQISKETAKEMYVKGRAAIQKARAA